MNKAVGARAKLRHNRELKGVGGDIWRQRLKRDESDVLDLESAASCLRSQYNTNVKNIRHQAPGVVKVKCS